MHKPCLPPSSQILYPPLTLRVATCQYLVIDSHVNAGSQEAAPDRTPDNEPGNPRPPQRAKGAHTAPQGKRNVLKIVMEDMEAGEVAAMYEEGGSAIILVARHLPDDQRCAAVNELLSHVDVRLSPYRFPRLLPPSPPAETWHVGPGSLGVHRLAR